METPFVREMREWRPGGKSDDDGLDAVAGALSSEPVRLPRFAAGQTQSPVWAQGVKSLTAPHDFTA